MARFCCWIYSCSIYQNPNKTLPCPSFAAVRIAFCSTHCNILKVSDMARETVWTDLVARMADVGIGDDPLMLVPDGRDPPKVYCPRSRLRRCAPG